MRHEWDLIPGEPAGAMRNRVAADLSTTMESQTALEVLTYARELFGTKLAIVSSFGAESVVLLHLASLVDKDIPVLFIDTHMLFEQTLQYQLDVAQALGLTNIKRISADDIVLRLSDPNGDLHKKQPDDCCHLRKTMPLEIELLKFDAWVTGRKRHQTSMRADMALLETDGPDRMKINPLANWSATDIAEYMTDHNLPRHPLVADGFASIGCEPCTSRTKPGEDPRSGRWRGAEKTECGIHFGADGVIKRNSEKAA